MSTIGFRSGLNEGIKGVTNRLVYLGGAPGEWVKDAVKQIRTGCFGMGVANPSLETQQLASVARSEALASLYVVSPKQTGFNAVAALMASAIQNPDKTVAVFTVTDGDVSVTDAERADQSALKDTLREAGAQVFDTIADGTAYINTLVDKAVGEQPPVTGEAPRSFYGEIESLPDAERLDVEDD